MTNYNEKLDKILEEFVDGCDCRIDEGQAYLHLSEFAADEAKQAITSLIKELVAEAKPNTSGFSDEYWRVNGSKVILMFEAKLLKALEEL